LVAGPLKAAGGAANAVHPLRTGKRRSTASDGLRLHFY